MAIYLNLFRDSFICDADVKHKFLISSLNMQFNRESKMKKVTIVGGGIIGAMYAYVTYMDAKRNNEQVRITIYDKNQSINQSTAAKLTPSLTPNEILAVVPPADVLIDKLGIMFSQPGGIRVDIPAVNDSPLTKRFIEQVIACTQDPTVNKARTDALLKLGKLSMDLWQQIYDEADPKFKAILEQANFKPCHENTKQPATLNDGYRIDLLHKPDAIQHAMAIRDDMRALGFQNSKLLSPNEVKALDPFLADFCNTHAKPGLNEWQDGIMALYRPGGCLDSGVFLPLLYEYLTQEMGTYLNANGVEKPCFRLKLERNVTAIKYAANDENPAHIDGLEINSKIKRNKHEYTASDYVFCPGENVGTFTKLGLIEPAYTGFAGVSFILNIPLSESEIGKFRNFSHCMEVYREGVVQATQARFKDEKIFIGMSGTKAFYADVKPQLTDEFARNRHLVQLNMMNFVYPEFLSWALERDTRLQELTANDLDKLVQKGIAELNVGTRMVYADGFPSYGMLTREDNVTIDNALGITGAGSGGVSFAPALIFTANKVKANWQQAANDDVMEGASNDETFTTEASFTRDKPRF